MSLVNTLKCFFYQLLTLKYINMYVCAYICMYICMCTCVFMYVTTYMCIYIMWLLINESLESGFSLSLPLLNQSSSKPSNTETCWVAWFFPLSPWLAGYNTQMAFCHFPWDLGFLHSQLLVYLLHNIYHCLSFCWNIFFYIYTPLYLFF